MRIHHVHFYVSNALQTSQYYVDKLGFEWAHARGPQQKHPWRNSIVVRQGNVRLRFTSFLNHPSALQPLANDGAQIIGSLDACDGSVKCAAAVATAHVENETFFDILRTQGDSVFDVALEVEDVYASFERAINNGAIEVQKPKRLHWNEQEYVDIAAVRTPFGRWRHTLIRVHTKDTSDLFLPGFESIVHRNQCASSMRNTACRFESLDHLAVAIEKDTAARVIEFYRSALGFERFLSNDDDNAEEGLQVQGSAFGSGDGQSQQPAQPAGGGLRTMVAAPGNCCGCCNGLSGSGPKTCHKNTNAQNPGTQSCCNSRDCFKIVFVEPVNRNGDKSQIQEFLDFHGTGIAHIALGTDDIVSAVESSKARGVPYILVPDQYYDSWKAKKTEAWQRIADAGENWNRLQQAQILVDHNANRGRSEFTYLLQTFTEPLQDRPTFYLELICRRGANGFGKGNIGALFDAIYLLQKKRGNDKLEEESNEKAQA